MKNDTGEVVMQRVITNQEEKQRILTACHSGIDGSHFGRDKTYSKVCTCFIACIVIFVYLIILGICIGIKHV